MSAARREEETMASFEERARAAATALAERTTRYDDACRALHMADAMEPEIGAVRRWLAGEAVDEATLPERLREVLSERDSMRIGCEIAYRREPTQAEGDAHENPITGDGECFVAMGGWTGRRCRLCNRWTWGGPTACVECVLRSNARDAAESAPALADAAAKGETVDEATLPRRLREVLSERDECSPRIAALLATDEPVTADPTAPRFSAEVGSRAVPEALTREVREGAVAAVIHRSRGVQTAEQTAREIVRALDEEALRAADAARVDQPPPLRPLPPLDPHDPTPDDGVDWRARALAAEAEVTRLRTALARATARLTVDEMSDIRFALASRGVGVGDTLRFIEDMIAFLAARRAEAMGGSDADA